MNENKNLIKNMLHLNLYYNNVWLNENFKSMLLDINSKIKVRYFV